MEQSTTKLRQGVRNFAHRYGIPPFWRWWVTELASFVPGKLRTAVTQRRIRPVLAFDAGTAVLWAPHTAAGALELHEVARIALAGDAAAVSQAGRAALERLPLELRGRGALGARLIVALPRSQVLRKQFDLPAAVEENLKQAIAWDLDRHTPFPPEQLYFDAHVIGRDAQKREIRVDWAAAQRTHVDHALRLAEGWGALVVGVSPDAPRAGDPAAVSSHGLNLLPDDVRPESRHWRRWQVWVPLVVLVVAALSAVALPLWQKRDYAIALAQVTEEERVKAAAADALRSQLEKSTSDYNFALIRKYAYPPTVQLLEDVSKLLPDDTWLLQFELKTAVRGKETQREMLLRGESGSAGRLVALLEDSKMFEQASPRSPMTKIQPGPGEIFDIGALLKPLAPPPMIELAAAAPRPAEASSPAASAAPSAPAVPAGSAPAVAPDAAGAPASSPPKAAATAAGSPPAPAPAPGPASAAGAPPPVARDNASPSPVAPEGAGVAPPPSQGRSGATR